MVLQKELDDTYKEIKQTATHTHGSTRQWTVSRVLSALHRVAWRRTAVMTGFTHTPNTADKLSRHRAHQASAVDGGGGCSGIKMEGKITEKHATRR